MFSIHRFIYPGLLRNIPQRFVSLKVIQETKKTKKESYDEMNMRLGRPLSPYIIYKPQLTTIMSISHRITGLMLSAYVSSLGIGALVCSQDLSEYSTMVDGLQMSPIVLTATKFILIYPLAYHTANGIRHLAWDTGSFLTIDHVYLTGYIAFGASILLAGILSGL